MHVQLGRSLNDFGEFAHPKKTKALQYGSGEWEEESVQTVPILWAADLYLFGKCPSKKPVCRKQKTCRNIEAD